MANKPLPKIVGNEEDYKDGFQGFIDLHGSTYEAVGAFCIKPPEGENFTPEFGRSYINYPIREWTQQTRKKLFPGAYQMNAKTMHQYSMDLAKWIKKEVTVQYFYEGMSTEKMNDTFWNVLLPSKYFNPNYATGITDSILPSKCSFI